MKEIKPNIPNEDPQTIHPKVVGRSKALFLIALLLFGLLLLRILLLQTLQYDKYQRKVIEQMTTEAEVTASRGNIYDANGTLLATNISTYRIFISPSSIAYAQTEHNEMSDGVQLDALIAEHLSSILDVSYDFVMKQTTYTKYLDRTIQKEVDEERANKVRAFIDEYGLQSMVYLQTTKTRYYPYANLASHVLGFTSSDGAGLYGLEYSYDKLLSGTNGRYITARDAQGREMPYSHKEYIAAEDGYNLNTTIDVFVQSALQEQVQNAYLESNGQNRAAGIVMNVNTGEILGMATYPDFNLNQPRNLDDQSLGLLADLGLVEGTEAYSEVKQALLMNMWKNKAITDPYIPGSTFKVVTAAMALEEKTVGLDECITCKGYLKVLGHTIHCHKDGGHGTLTFVEGIQQSCNPWLMTVGGRLGRTTFYSYIKSFGYLEKTGIDLPGEDGSVFASEEAFTDLDLAIYAFGQNFSVTLIQQATAISAVANGGYLVTPHMVNSVTDDDGKVIQSFDTVVRRQVVSTQVCQTVSEILEGGVSGNGGAKNAYVAGYRVAAKTGTSEKKERECPICDSTGVATTVDGQTKYKCTICKYVGEMSEFETSEDYVCSTVAYAPADNPQYAVIIIVDEPTSGLLYGSTVAAPYVGNVMETILPYLGVEAVYSEEELKNMAVTVPNVYTWSGSAAESRCEKAGLTVEFVGDPAGVVIRQIPEAGTVVEKSGGKIILYTDRDAEVEQVTVPDLTGLTAVAANQKLINAGLNIRILGTKNYLSGTGANVIAQSIAPGSVVAKGTVVEVTFRHLNDLE